MPAIDRSVASLRIIGDDLLPQEITDLLGGAPTSSHAKGDIVRHPHPGAKERVARFGMWSLRSTARAPENVDEQVAEILAGLTSNLAAWQTITQKHRAEIFCGLFLKEVNEGFTLKPQTMAALCARGLSIGFDIYGPIGPTENA